MSHIRINNRSLVQPSQSTLARKGSNLLSEEIKDEHRERIYAQDSRKGTRNNLIISRLEDPIEKSISHTERNSLFAKVHNDQHLSDVGIIRVNSIGLFISAMFQFRAYQNIREVEVRSPVRHGYSSHVSEPMSLILGRHSVADQTSGGDDHGGEQDRETHLSFSDTVIFAGEMSGNAIREESERERKEISSCACARDESRVDLRPVIGGCGDNQWKGIVEC